MRRSGGAQTLPRNVHSGKCLRIIVLGEVDIGYLAEELDTEVLSCENLSRLGKLCKEVTSTLLIIDLPALTKIEQAVLLKLLGHHTALLPVALLDVGEDSRTEELLRAGFVGVLERNASHETVLRAIRLIIDGQLWFPRKTISHVIRDLLFKEELTRLTSREREILTLIGSGLNNQEIANRLFISRETVRWHLRGLYSKLGIEGRHSAQQYLRSAKPVQSQSKADLRRPVVAS
jgi:DNA-binding NarL/FixJ family response regulator